MTIPGFDPVTQSAKFNKAMSEYKGPELCFISYYCEVTHFDLDRCDWYRGAGFYGVVKEYDRKAVHYGPFESEVAAKDFMPPKTPTHGGQ